MSGRWSRARSCRGRRAEFRRPIHPPVRSRHARPAAMTMLLIGCYFGRNRSSPEESRRGPRYRTARRSGRGGPGSSSRGAAVPSSGDRFPHVRVRCQRIDAHSVMGIKEVWCRLPDSNWRPDAYKATALPTELSRQYRPRLHRRGNAAERAPGSKGSGGYGTGRCSIGVLAATHERRFDSTPLPIESHSRTSSHLTPFPATYE